MRELQRHHDFSQALRVRGSHLLGRRGTSIPTEPRLSLTMAFATDPTKAAQWRAFMSRGRLAPADLSLSLVVEAVERFLWPPLEAAGKGSDFAAQWPPGGPAWT